jgi:hypothetical protein
MKDRSCLCFGSCHRFLMALTASCLLAGLFGALLTAPAHAQLCTSDLQCPGSGRGIATCNGDTLVIKRSLCVGSCQERVERSETCAPRAAQAISCSGNIAVRTGGGCDASLQRCSTRMDRDVCVKSCACVGKKLIVSTGMCVSGVGCARSVVQCNSGCTCSGEPRCL